MKKILFFSALTLAICFISSCQNGKNNSEYENTEDTVAINEKIQDTFYSCTFGQSRDSVLAKFVANGFHVGGVNRPDFVTFYHNSNEDFEFGGLVWAYTGLEFTDGIFSGIGFYANTQDKKTVMDNYNNIESRLTSKYIFYEEPTDSVTYAIKRAEGKNGVNCLIKAERYESVGKQIWLEAVLYYYSTKIEDTDMDEL